MFIFGRFRRGTSLAAVMVAAGLVGGCQELGNWGRQIAASSGTAEPKPANTAAEVMAGKWGESEAREATARGLKALRDGDVREASASFNLALKLDITNSRYQFLNALTYHLMALNGDASKFALAEQGYSLAMKFDSTNWRAQYGLGLSYMDQHKYDLAQAVFAEVALHHWRDPSVLYCLAISSYYAHDPRSADAALTGLVKVAPQMAARPEILRARAMIKGALNDKDNALQLLDSYAALPNLGRDQAMTLRRRLEDWEDAYAFGGRVELAQFSGSTGGVGSGRIGGGFGSSSGGFGNQSGFGSQNGFGNQSGFGSQNGFGNQGGMGTQNGAGFGNQTGTQGSGGRPPGGGGFFDPNMVVVDVVLIGTQEDTRDTRGINLLSGLQLQFGNPLSNIPAFSWQKSNLQNATDRTLSSDTTTFTRYISIPAVTYSLNIANAIDAGSEILARPSLVALAGQTSEFFSGTEVSAAAVSGGNGDAVSIQKEVGVKLAVTPEFLPNDMIRLQVSAIRTFLADPSQSVLFQFRMDTTKTLLNATVAMKFGETLVLGGLSEREITKNSNGVPYLRKVPGLSSFFDRSDFHKFEQSILILLTPRRPQYSRQAEVDRNEVTQKMSDLERSLERMENRHQDWFLPKSTLGDINERLHTYEFLQEFRSGDLGGNEEGQSSSSRDRLSNLLDG